MKFECKKSDLVNIVQTVIQAVSAKAVNPILSGLKIETAKDKLKISATSLDISLSATMSIECDEEISIIVPAQKFLTIIRELTDIKNICISAKDNKAIIIKDTTSTFKIACLSVEEYPKISYIETNTVTINHSELKDALNKVSFVIPTDNARPLLRSVFFNLLNSKLTLVTTDGKRLATAEMKVSNEGPINFVLPAKSVNILEKLSNSKEITVTYNKTQVMFSTENVKFISNLLENNFPAYEKVIPKETTDKLVVDKIELISALKKAALLTTQDSISVMFDITKDKLTITKKTEFDNVQSILSCNYSQELKISFNPIYLIEILNRIDGNAVSLELNGNDKPAALRKKDDYLFVVLPTKIQD